MNTMDDQAEVNVENNITWQIVLKYFLDLKHNFFLLFVILIPIMLISVYMYFSAPKMYTATAVIAPPQQSPTDAFLSGGGGGLSSNIAAKALGSSSNSTYFDMYKQLLHSTRMAEVLIKKDHFLQKIYANRWDAQKGMWRPLGPVAAFRMQIKSALGMPVMDNPDTDELVAYLNNNIVVVNKTQKSKDSIFSSSPSYQTVSFTFRDRAQAQAMLNTVLMEADTLVRDDLRKTVTLRLRFLYAQLSNSTGQTNMRDALISVISSQEQLRAMLEVDPRIASQLIDPPYASRMPTSWGLKMYLEVSVALSVFLWGLLVFLFNIRPAVRKRLSWVLRRRD